ncbi:MAG: UvrD-helicase domain-containing protein [Burkholderiaceae bacterium]|nr:UvrD-helicase domain-containing protein [Burkholderiaceae bacterium]
MRLLEQLNDRQREAVTLPAEHALVLAGAGSGKTRVLTTRIAWLISTGQASPHGILAVTFTNKAAREMLTRLSAMLPIEPRGMWIGTFHGLANRMLRAHHRDAGLPHTFQILDSQDQLAAIKRLLRTLNVDDEKCPPKSLQHFVNGAKEEGRRAGAVEAYDEHTRRMVELYAAYDEQCQREGVVDFAELLLRSRELLARNAPLREHYRARFRHILVDEFQDTNTLQYEWLKLLAGESSVLFAVGDDDQSIYSFRGARVANMAAFEREFRVAHLIRLEQNYRSHANILDCANALIAHNRNRLGKNLWTDAGEGEPVRVRESLGDAQEAQWLVEEIRSLVAEGWMRSDIAVLYRSNAQSRVLEHALFSSGVPYRVYGGLRFFERAEIKHALAYLRLMENPDDDGAFLRVANFPARGIGARTLESLQDQARRSGTGLFASAASVPGAGGSRLAAFVQLVARLRADTQALSLPEVVAHVIEASGLVAHYRSEREGQERVENLRELVNAAASFVAEEGIATGTPANLGVAGGPRPASSTVAQAFDSRAGSTVVETDASAAPGAVQTTPLAAFLAHASLEAGENQAGEGTDAVQMMTVHSAKGLEFDAVFLTGLEEGLFPHENSIVDPQGLEEERRLMYVAITRARKRLYLSFAQTRMLHGHTRYNLRSRFLDELPPALLKWLGARPRPVPGPGGGPASRWGATSASISDGRGASDARHEPFARSAEASGRATGWRVGQNVAHARFGEGVIVAIEGSGEDARAQVRFEREGTKWLALAIARLEPCG